MVCFYLLYLLPKYCTVLVCITNISHSAFSMYNTVLFSVHVTRILHVNLVSVTNWWFDLVQKCGGPTPHPRMLEHLLSMCSHRPNAAGVCPPHGRQRPLSNVPSERSSRHQEASGARAERLCVLRPGVLRSAARDAPVHLRAAAASLSVHNKSWHSSSLRRGLHRRGTGSASPQDARRRHRARGRVLRVHRSASDGWAFCSSFFLIHQTILKSHSR